MSDRDERLVHHGDEEPEPDWAERIRAARKARGDELRGVFATFDDDDPAGRDGPPSRRPAGSRSPAARPPAEPYDHEQEPPP